MWSRKTCYCGYSYRVCCSIISRSIVNKQVRLWIAASGILADIILRASLLISGNRWSAWGSCTVGHQITIFGNMTSFGRPPTQGTYANRLIDNHPNLVRPSCVFPERFLRGIVRCFKCHSTKWYVCEFCPGFIMPHWPRNKYPMLCTLCTTASYAPKLLTRYVPLPSHRIMRI